MTKKKINPYLQLLNFCTTKENRRTIASVRNKIWLEAPYDEVLDALLDIMTDDVLSLKDIQAIASRFLSEEDLFLLKKVGIINKPVGWQILKNLTALWQEEKIGQILKSNMQPQDKVYSIQNVAQPVVSVSKSRAKLVDTFEIENDRQAMVSLIGYKFYRGDVVVLAAAPGCGKTTSLLSFNKQAALNGYKVLHISINDFTETSLLARLPENYPNIYVAVYPSASLWDIELEIENIKPDMVSIDYLGVINSYSNMERRNQVEKLILSLAEFAKSRDILVLTAYQLNKIVKFPNMDDLLDCHAQLAANSDWILGLGTDKPESPVRYVTTIKIRHQAANPVKSILLNYETLDIIEEVRSG